MCIRDRNKTLQIDFVKNGTKGNARLLSIKLADRTAEGTARNKELEMRCGKILKRAVVQEVTKDTRLKQEQKCKCSNQR